MRSNLVAVSEHELNPKSIIVARPHFRRSSQDLYFFLSDRVFHHLSSAELAIWEELEDGPRQLESLNDVAAVSTLADAKTIEIIEPVSEGDRRPILVVEPHSDDAALSIGAIMWKMRDAAEFHLLTMASRSNYTSSFHLHREYFDRSRITRMRTIEGELFMAHLGGQYHCAGMAEATLRYHDGDWDLGFYNAHKVPIAISNNRRAGAATLAAWAEKLDEFLDGRSFDEIWLPLGAGTHSDHDLARNAALEVLQKRRMHSVIRLYEDVPYGAQFEEHADRILRMLTESGAKLSEWFQEVTDVFPKKLDLLTIFASQFKVTSIQSDVERSAERVNTDGRKFARLWTVDALPQELPKDAIWIGAPQVAEVSAHVSMVPAKSYWKKRLAIFAISASGRWSEDFDLLAGLYPKAKIVVYAGPKVCAEFMSKPDPRVELHCLDGSAGSWIRAALREAVTTQRIVIAGDAAGKAKLLTKVWLIGRKVMVSEMDHLAQALEQMGRRSRPKSG